MELFATSESIFWFFITGTAVHLIIFNFAVILLPSDSNVSLKIMLQRTNLELVKMRFLMYAQCMSHKEKNIY